MAGPSNAPTSSEASSAPAEKPSPRYSVRALERGLCLLSALATRREASLGELAGDCNLSKPSAFRLLVTMTRMRFVEQDPRSKRYRLGVRNIELGHGYQTGHDIVLGAGPHLAALASSLKDVAGLAIIEMADVVIVSRTTPDGSTAREVGSLRLPNATPAAAVILALTAQRQQDAALASLAEGGEDSALRTAIGHASERGHLVGEGTDANSIAAAAPVLNRAGAPVGALVLLNGEARRTRSQIEKDVVPVLRNHARSLSAELGFEGTYPGD